MNKYFNILLIVSSLAAGLLLKGNHTSTISMVTNVFAGIDTSICQSASLHLPHLNARIIGDVTNGYWFTLGDGFFDPGGLGHVRFSTGQNYFPGAQDISNGQVKLLLSSDDPDGFGPLSQVTDTVTIYLRGNPTLICHSNLNISLNNQCTETVTPQMLLSNAQLPYSQYNITMTDPSGNIIPNNMLTSAHINKTITVSVGHQCGTNTCWGAILVKDNTPPTLQCANFNVDCGRATIPDSIGFPVPNTATVTSLPNQKYNAKNLDVCSDVILSYNDSFQDLNCINGMQERIIRVWSGVDMSGNQATCTQVISVKTKPLSQVMLPLNYDGVTRPTLSCGGSFPVLANGHPSPAHTGTPDAAGCKKLEYTYSDVTFPACGGGKKILRKWLLIDWCSNQTLEHNQIIEITDKKAPTANSPDSIGLYTGPYDCYTLKSKLPLFTNLKDCSKIDTSFILRDTFGHRLDSLVFVQKDTFYVDSLPVGYYIGGYQLKDICGNVDTFDFKITVQDNRAPFAICKQFLKVSLTTAGTGRMFASSVDNGSLDNCAIDSMDIAKMTDGCGNAPLVYRSYVDFCCAETGAPVMVAFRVTDKRGNTNTCMSQITVEDKELPTISCPSNLTISCTNVIDTTQLSVFGNVVKHPSLIRQIIINDGLNNGDVGSDGLAFDQCSFDVTSKFTLNVNSCGTESLIRVFTAKDMFGNESKCQQNILITNDKRFGPSNIVWPTNYDIVGCDTVTSNLDVTGKPTYIGVTCSQPQSTFDDIYFYNTNEACVKIVRNWTVIDWCTFNPVTQTGRFTYAQIIKINNNIKPNISPTCKDTTVLVTTDQCSNAVYQYDLSGSDDCTPVSQLKWAWQLDRYNNSSIDFIGNTPDITASLGIGTHLLKAMLKDQCGNTDSCTYNIIMKDGKKPSPYCTSSISTALMPSSGSLVINAKTFGINSYDNCTPTDSLRFSFTSMVKDSTMTFTCDSITDGVSQVFSLKVYVTDKAENFDFCIVNIKIDDNDDACQDDQSYGTINGELRTFNSKKIRDAVVSIETGITVYNQSKWVDTLGRFTFEYVPTPHPLKISVNKEHTSVREEITTLDLIKLQRHILELEPFVSPYQYIAGDANGSKKLSVSDVVAIRKVLLGINDSFAPGVPSWRFLDSKHTFEDNANPWNFTDTLTIDSIHLGVLNTQFVGIKMGDVNGSAGKLKNTQNTENRSLSRLNMKRDGNVYSFMLDNETPLFGMQFSLSIDDIKHIKVNPLFENMIEYNYSDQRLHFIFYNDTPFTISSKDVVFEIRTSSPIKLDDRGLAPELYHMDQTNELILDLKNSTNDNGKSLMASVLGQHIVIHNLDDLSDGEVNLYSATGQKLWSQRLKSHYPIPHPSGIYFLQYHNGKELETVKIFVP